MPTTPPLANPVHGLRRAVPSGPSRAPSRAGRRSDVAEANARALLPLSEDGRVGTITWTFDVDSVADVEPATREALLDALATARDDGLTAEVNGSGHAGDPRDRRHQRAARHRRRRRSS